MGLVIPANGRAAKLLVGNRILTEDNQLITPGSNYLSRFTDASQSPGALSTVGAALDIATTAGLWYSHVATPFTVTNPANTELRGSVNYLSGGNTGNSGSGAVFFQLPAFALEGSDLGKPVSLSFDTTGNTSANDWDLVVVRYNASGVFQGLIPVAGNASNSSSTPSAQLPTGVAQFRGFFVPTADVGHLYAVRFRRLAGDTQIRLDTLYAGPQVQLSGIGGTKSVARYSRGTVQSIPDNAVTIVDFATSNFDTNSEVTTGASWRFTAKAAGYYDVKASVLFDSSTAWAVSTKTAEIQLRKNGVQVSFGDRVDWLPSGSGLFANIKHSDSIYLIAGDYIDIRVTQNTGGALNIYNNVIYNFVNISSIDGPNSNVTMAERALEEYAWNSSGITAAGATNIVAFANGPAGAAIGSIASTTASSDTEMLVRFQTPIQATDRITVEINEPEASGGWVDAAQFFSRLAQGTSRYGIRADSPNNSTDVNVRFGNRGANSGNATYAGDGQAWSVFGSYRWRVRKVSSGAAIGGAIGTANIVGRVDGLAPAAGMLGQEQLGTINVSSATTQGTLAVLSSYSINRGVYLVQGTCALLINTVVGGFATGVAVTLNNASLPASSIQIPVGPSASAGCNLQHVAVLNVTSDASTIRLLGIVYGSSGAFTWSAGACELKMTRIA